MNQHFMGFDPLPLNENGFELTRDGKVFLSLYHDMRLSGFDFDGNDFLMYLAKAKGAAHDKTLTCSRWKLVLESAKIVKIESRGEDNFQDVNDLTLTAEHEDHLEIILTIGAMTLTLECKRLVLSEDPTGDDWLYAQIVE